MKSVLIVAPPAAPRIGTICAAAFCDTTMPKREPISATRRTSAGAPALVRPFCARYFEASDTAVASAARAAK